jgi:Helix-turn-helix domain
MSPETLGALPPITITIPLDDATMHRFAAIVAAHLRVSLPTPEPTLALAPYMTVKEAAADLKRCTRTVRSYIAKGLLRPSRVLHSGSSQLLIPRSQVERLRDGGAP